MLEKVPNTKFYEIHPMRAVFFHADGQTYTTKLTVAFPKFANVP